MPLLFVPVCACVCIAETPSTGAGAGAGASSSSSSSSSGKGWAEGDPRLDPTLEEEGLARSTHTWTVRVPAPNPNPSSSTTCAGAGADAVVLAGCSIGTFTAAQHAEALSLIAQAGAQLLLFVRGALQ